MPTNAASPTTTPRHAPDKLSNPTTITRGIRQDQIRWVTSKLRIFVNMLSPTMFGC